MKAHDHSHSHHHDDSHAGHHHHHHSPPKDFSRSFIAAVILNTLFVIVESLYGFLANSTALLADAGHNLSDVLGLLLAWGAAILSRRPPNSRYTYGLRSSSILAALANAMFLLIACGAIAWEAVQRFSLMPQVAGFTVSVVATVGIFVNGVSAWLFMQGSKTDLNIRGAYLHMAADAVVSLAVAIAGILIAFTGAQWIDPIVSLLVVGAIVIGTWSLLRDSMKLALNAVPASIHIDEVLRHLRAWNGVSDVHDLHVWGMSTTEIALTAHLVMPAGYPGDKILDEIQHSLLHEFGIHHCTLQIEEGTTHHVCHMGQV